MAVDLDELAAKLATAGLSEEERKLIDVALHFMKYMADFKNSTGPFICGHGGHLDSGGLYESYHICAAYGSDYVAIYKKATREPPIADL